MAQYKVPQDVEAEDRLLGPFTFRQFIYLVIATVGIAAAWGLFQLFPPLAILPVPIALFFIVLALPLKKDQPMETYLAAVISYHTKPRKRIWTPGQQESTIEITAPKTVEAPRARALSEEEASHRLSFLADIIDTEGYSIRGDHLNSSMRDEYIAEAETVTDMFDQPTPSIDRNIQDATADRHTELVAQMRAQLAAREQSAGETSPFIHNGF